MRILVIGAAGFLGSHLVPALLEEGHELAVCDVVPPDDARRLSKALERIRYIWKSVFDLNTNDFAGFDWIIDLAAVTDVPLAINSPKWCWDLNTDGVLTILEALRSLGQIDTTLAPPGLIFMSTESVYGLVPKEKHPITEEQPFNPVNVYGASKAAAELLIRAYSIEFGIKAVILRCTSMFGENGRPKQVIPIFIRQALAGSDITIEGDGSQSRDFSYVGNTVKAILLAMKHGQSGIWNLGCGSEYSIGDMAKRIIELTASSSKIVYKSWRVGERGVQLPMSIDKARRELGYTPALSVDDGLRRTIEWFRVEM